MPFVFCDLRWYTSGSAWVGTKCLSANMAIHEAPYYLIPYSGLTITITFPFLSPCSKPAINHIFSLQGALRYKFPTSQAMKSRSFNYAMRKAMRTLSLDTTEEYVRLNGASAVDPLATVQKFPGEIHLHIKDKVTCYFLKPNKPWGLSTLYLFRGRLVLDICYFYLQHLLCYFFSTEVRVSFLVNHIC